MKFPKPITIQGALSTLLVTKWAFGIGCIEYPVGHSRRALSLCWTIAHFFLLLCVIIISWTTLSPEKNLASGKISWNSFSLFAILTSSTLQLYFGQARSKSVMTCLRKINKLDKTLYKIGIPGEYRMIFKTQIIELLGFFFVILTISVINLNYQSRGEESTIIWFAANSRIQYIIIFNFFDLHVFSICIRHIRRRFQHLNIYLAKLSTKNENANLYLQELQSNWRSPWLQSTTLRHHTHSRRIRDANEQWTKHAFRCAKEIHYDLCSISRHLNKAFGDQVLVTVISYFYSNIMWLAYGYAVIPMISTSTVGNTLFISYLLLGIGFFCGIFIHLAYICTATSTEAQRTGEVIYEIIEPSSGSEITEEVLDFSRELGQNFLQFTASEFFTLDFKLIKTIVLMTITYAVFVLQVGDLTAE